MRGICNDGCGRERPLARKYGPLGGADITFWMPAPSGVPLYQAGDLPRRWQISIVAAAWLSV
jgi:hypothetical protein